MFRSPILTKKFTNKKKDDYFRTARYQDMTVLIPPARAPASGTIPVDFLKYSYNEKRQNFTVEYVSSTKIVKKHWKYDGYQSLNISKITISDDETSNYGCESSKKCFDSLKNNKSNIWRRVFRKNHDFDMAHCTINGTKKRDLIYFLFQKLVPFFC